MVMVIGPRGGAKLISVTVKADMRRLLLCLLAIAALAVAACGDDDDSSAAATTQATLAEESTEPAAAPKPKPGAEITTAASDYGTILFGEGERAIYLFDREASDESECYGACAEAWPPVLTEGEPQAAGDLEQSKLGTTRRDDGATQVTYDGHPLYFYVDDPPGEVLCHNVTEFGGVWLVVDPGGDAVA
jgi:predicted lipoprotein with Yx(FWY)xxD motif